MSSLVSFIINILTIYLIVFICTLLHELGHGIPAILLTKVLVNIKIGSANTPPHLSCKIGNLKLHINLHSLYQGETFFNPETLSRFRRNLIYLGGPIISFLTASVSFLIFNISASAAIGKIFYFTFLYALAEGIFSIVPMKYPKFLFNQESFSDGYYVFRNIK